MRRKECQDCHLPLEEHNDTECYDREGNDAEWDDTRKCWVCIDCWHKLPSVVKE